MTNWTTILIIIVILVALDKTITVMNIKAVARNHPDTNALSIEKNPVAKWSFEKMGLLWGSLAYGLFSIATFLFALLLFYYPAKYYAPDNAVNVAFYVMMIFYGAVIFNNLYFYLRYNNLL